MSLSSKLILISKLQVEAGHWWVHASNPSYSELGRDQKDCVLKPAWANTLSRKNPSQKRAGGVTQGVGPEFKPTLQKKPPKNYKLISTVPSAFILGVRQ
jgi:hypothetical protein